MIFELRTYTLKPRSLPEVEKRFGEAYEHRKKYSELAGFFHTEIGQLNQIVHIWRYNDLAERDRVRQEVAGEPNWPAAIQEFIVNATAEIVTPFPFSADFPAGNHGPIYELREYHFRVGVQPQIMQAWERSLPARLERSPMMLGGFVELGSVNKFVHIWAYKDLNERMDVRTKATVDGIWPPAGPTDLYFSQHSSIMLPASFSPAQ